MKWHIFRTVPYAVIGIAVGMLSTNVAWLPYHPAIVGLVGALFFRGLVYLRGLNAKKFRKDVEYGSARWRVES